MGCFATLHDRNVVSLCPAQKKIFCEFARPKKGMVRSLRLKIGMLRLCATEMFARLWKLKNRLKNKIFCDFAQIKTNISQFRVTKANWANWANLGDPGRGLQLMIRPTRPKLDMFRPTRPKAFMFWLRSPKEKYFDHSIPAKKNFIRNTTWTVFDSRFFSAKKRFNRKKN